MEAEPPPQAGGHQDDLGVCRRTRGAEDLPADLVELAEPALLGALVAEHRTHVPEAVDAEVDEAVLDAGPDAARGLLRAQGKAVPVAVGEGVHLLLDDVCRPSD